MCIATLISCSDENEVKIYKLAKDSSSPENTFHHQPPLEKMKLPANVGNSHSISWTTPPEWEEQPAHGMRSGSFLAKGKDELSIDISAIFLGGAAGGDLPNVNRWREQISLPPWTFDEFLNNQVMIDTPLGKAKIVDFSSEEKLNQGEHHTRIVAAILPYQGGTWFFKMTGEKTLMEVQKPIFQKFLEAVQAAQ